MKKITKILIIFFSILTFFSLNKVIAGVDLNNEAFDKIEKTSITSIESSGNIVNDINNTGMNILKVVKLIFEGVLILYIVYAGAQMIMSMGTDEDNLSKAKTSLRYSVVGLVFINIPGSLYYAFKQDNYGTINGNVSYTGWFYTPGTSTNNLLINTFNFGQTLNGDIIGFIEVALSAIAILMIIIAGINIVKSRGKEEEYSESINKITWSVIGLVFIGFIEVFKKVIFSGNVEDGSNLFASMSNLALFFAGPVAISFLTLAAYYYITSNGDEEKTKKAKSIVINTVIATVILLASYTFLLDLATL